MRGSQRHGPPTHRLVVVASSVGGGSSCGALRLLAGGDGGGGCDCGGLRLLAGGGVRLLVLVSVLAMC